MEKETKTQIIIVIFLTLFLVANLYDLTQAITNKKAKAIIINKNWETGLFGDAPAMIPAITVEFKTTEKILSYQIKDGKIEETFISEEKTIREPVTVNLIDWFFLNKGQKITIAYKQKTILLMHNPAITTYKYTTTHTRYATYFIFIILLTTLLFITISNKKYLPYIETLLALLLILYILIGLYNIA